MSLSRALVSRARAGIRRLVEAPIVRVDELHLGRNVRIEPGVRIACRRLVVGDGVTIRAGTVIEMADLVIGDYTTINAGCVFTGTGWCRIGHNCWFGHYTVVDSIGTTRIGDNVGVGAHSQLWTHAYFGDVLAGCTLAQQEALVLEDDVWLVGHCIVSPVHAGPRSMAMVGSVVTKDMVADHTYAGVPAKDVTDRFGPQFVPSDLATRRARMESYLVEFLAQARPRKNRIRIVDRLDPSQSELAQFGITERVYLKHLYPEEVAFMRFLLPTRAKFIPATEDWVGEWLVPGPAPAAPFVTPLAPAAAK